MTDAPAFRAWVRVLSVDCPSATMTSKGGAWEFRDSSVAGTVSSSLRVGMITEMRGCSVSVTLREG